MRKYMLLFLVLLIAGCSTAVEESETGYYINNGMPLGYEYTIIKEENKPVYWEIAY